MTETTSLARTTTSARCWLIGWPLGFFGLWSLAALTPAQAGQAGIDWDIVNTSLITAQPWNAVAYGNGRFIALPFVTSTTAQWGGNVERRRKRLELLYPTEYPG